jgi:acetyltransferase-like isoleucine patch superfamily enzyme
VVARIDPTALVEDDVVLGEETSVWDNAHLRGPSRIGRDCIIGGKTYVAYDVTIGDMVKLNAFVYVCAAVTIEDGVMVGAHSVFTNDRFPRATDPDLKELRSSEPDEHTRPTTVRQGATLGARVVVGSDLEIGAWAMVGMGSVVTRTVPAQHLVVGNPARTVGYVCRCGEPFHRGDQPHVEPTACPVCDRRYRVEQGRVQEQDPAA